MSEMSTAGIKYREYGSGFLKKLILASSSPRRVEIMGRFNLEFDVVPSDISESFEMSESPVVSAMAIALEKALDVAEREKESLVIGADTVVYCDGMMGKPRDREEAFKMLELLSGREHLVVTGIAMVHLGENRKLVDYDVTKVKFKKLSEAKINRYLDSGEYLDKAGSYAVQGIGEVLVERISGSYSNVVGLSVDVLEKMLENFEVELV